MLYSSESVCVLVLVNVCYTVVRVSVSCASECVLYSSESVCVLVLVNVCYTVVRVSVCLC